MRRQGATEAQIEALYREQFRAFLLTATAIVGDGQGGLDAVQDAFALALRRSESFRGEGNLEAWLWRIVLNVARDGRRARNRKPPAVLDPAPAAVPDPDEDLRASLLALPERQRLAVFLRYYADLSYEQIAELLGIRPGTVAASLNAAHAALRRRLEEVAR